MLPGIRFKAFTDFVEAENACEEALLSRIRRCDQWAREVDEHYGYKLFVGKDRQAQKRLACYMRLQRTIHSHITEAVRDLLRCQGAGNDDISLLARILVQRALSHMPHDASSSMRTGKEVRKGKPETRGTPPSPADPMLLRQVMSSFLEKVEAGGVQFRCQNERARDRGKRASPRDETR